MSKECKLNWKNLNIHEENLRPTDDERRQLVIYLRNNILPWLQSWDRLYKAFIGWIEDFDVDNNMMKHCGAIGLGSPLPGNGQKDIDKIIAAFKANGWNVFYDPEHIEQYIFTGKEGMPTLFTYEY
jgi:hypothetical protein